MTRFVPVTVLVMVLAAGRVASADDTTPPTGPLASGAAITFSELKIHEDNSPTAEFPKVDPTSKWNYFNLAHCQCDTPGANPGSNFHETTFSYLLKLEGANGMAVNRPLEIWVGTNCMTDTARPPSTTATCHKIDSAGLTSVDQLTSPGNVRPEIPIFDFMTSTPGATTCLAAQQSSTLWALVDTNMNNIPDYFASQQLTTDSLPPPLPTDFHAAGGDGAIEISWKPPSDASDIYRYQALCARADTKAPGKTTGRPDRQYQTASTLCGLPQTVNLGTGTEIPADATDTSAPVTVSDLPAALATLDPSFLCGEEPTATATSLRISGLENGVAYQVVLLAIDKFQNASGTFFTRTLTPVPAIDFWEDLHDRDSKAQGGLCLLAETYGDDSSLTGALRAFRDDTLGSSSAGRWLTRAYYATLGQLGGYVHGSVVLRLFAGVVLAPLVVIALLWHGLTLPGLLAVLALGWLWRRRKRGTIRPQLVRAASAAVIALVALAPGRAHAGGYQPYWETGDQTGDDQANPDDASLIRWHAGIRVGPYVPAIDKQLGMDPGPYKDMFGGAQVLPMLDVDRILWTGFGQIGVGGSIGYMQKSAHAFADGSTASDMDRARSTADTNKFRLIPMALTATYRFTWLDDQYGIPVVPYVRGGLAYYLWWISTSDGSLAQVCKGTGMEPDCSQNKALGGSLGIQGSIGLAIRAERVDAATATSMRQSGIQHAGIYGELSLAKVDGFGSDTKLSVGDRTWFAGVDFEF